MPKRLRDKSLVVVMRAFFDESAVSSKDGSHMIMAGFCGSVEAFEKASDAWQDCLDKTPAIPYFHHKDRNCLKKLARLTDVLCAHDLQGFVITVPHHHFRGRDSKLTKGMIGSRIYDWAFVFATRYVLLWVDSAFPEGEKVDFIFEKRRELPLCLDHLYNPFAVEAKGIWKRAGSCTPEEDKRVAALQMADLLAGEYLESLRVRKDSMAIEKLRKARPIFYFHKKPHEIIERSLLLHSAGKRLFDAGVRKILDSGEYVDPAIYEKEYRAIQLINRIAQRDNEELEKESKEIDEYYKNQS